MATDLPTPRSLPSTSARWETLTSARTLLAVARTHTSAVRLLDTLALFQGDDRVQILFTLDDTSAFSSGAREFLTATGAQLIPWRKARSLNVDAIVTASENVDTSQAKAPVLVLPHGIGFHKMVPDSRAPGERVSGVVPTRYRRRQRVWTAISHPEQREQLRRLDPQAAADCVLLGDPTYDRLIASLPLRARFRHLLGVEPWQRLVLLSSTWRSDSLLGRRPGLPARALRELPADEYRVALVTHPNIGSWHGAFHLRQVLADADETGLIRIPPTRGWQAVLIAADYVIGDHGSVTLYGASLGRPLLLSEPSAEIIPGTPPDRLRALVPSLQDDRPLEEQLHRAVDAQGDLREFAGRLFALRGQATAELRRFLYDLLKLPEPDHPAVVRAVADPVPDRTDPRSFVVYSHADAAAVHLWRHPTRGRRTAGRAGLFRHLACYEDEPDRLLVGNASVVARRRVTGEADARVWIHQTLTHYPGALMAVTTLVNGHIAGMRDGRTILVTGDSAGPLLAAAAVYTHHRAEKPLTGPVRLRTGGREWRLRLSEITVERAEPLGDRVGLGMSDPLVDP